MDDNNHMDMMEGVEAESAAELELFNKELTSAVRDIDLETVREKLEAAPENHDPREAIYAMVLSRAPFDEYAVEEPLTQEEIRKLDAMVGLFRQHAPESIK